MNTSNELDIISFQKSLQPLRPKQRLDAILNRPDAMKIVRQMPSQDLFITIKEVGLSDSLELLELLSPEQVKACLDLDGWNHDRIDPKALGHWLESLFAANPRRAVQSFRELDVELISLLLKLYATVYDLSAEEEAADLGSVYSTTPDNHYMVVFDAAADEQHLIHFLKDALEQLYGRDMPFALRMIEAVRWETASALEEEALKWRDGRMQDLGFAPLDEIKEILAYVDPAKALQGANDMALNDERSFDQTTSILLRQVSDHQLLAQALQGAPDSVSQRVMGDIVSTSNRVHMALSGDLGDPDALRASASHTVKTVEIALAFLSQGDPALLSRGLYQFSVQRLFQIGRSLALRIGREFKKVVADPNSGLGGEGLLRLDSPLAEVAAGILRPDPVYYDGLNNLRKIDYRPFESLKDVALSASAIAEASFRAYLLGPRGIGAQTSLAPKTVTHGVLFATWLCHALLDGKPSIQPMDQDDVQRLISRLDKAGEGRRFRAADVEASKRLATPLACSLVPSPSIKTEEEATSRAEQYVQVVLGVVENELSRIQDETVDLRFVSSLYVDGLQH